MKDARDLTLGELLLANRFPPSLFQAYEVPGDGSLNPVPMSRSLGDFPEGRKVVLQCVRNTDIDALQPAEVEPVWHAETPVTEIYDFQYAEDSKEPRHRVHLMDAATMREVIFGKISEFLVRAGDPLPLVAGISGGGDSNTLVHGLSRYLANRQLGASRVTCFTLVMEPMWPESAAHRAQTLCSQADLEHRVLHPEDIAQTLRMSSSPQLLWEDLSKLYGTDLAHFFGTFLINLVGRAISQEVGASSLLMGYNREDVMAELMFCLMNGRRPLEYPRKMTGDTEVLMPVWDVPKVMLDSCHPDFSEANYTERVDTTAVRRSSIYYMAHCLDALVPQMSISLLNGTAKLMDELSGWQELTPIGGTPLLHTGYGDAEEQHKILTLLKGYFPDWQL